MRVVYNGLFLTRPLTGSGQYTAGLLSELPSVMGTDEHVVLVPEVLEGEVPDGVRLEHVPVSRARLGRGLALDRWETHDVRGALRRLKADLYHAPYPTPPVPTDVPVVMTVHDMIPWRRSEYRRGWRRQLKSRRQLAGIAQATHLLTVSESAKQEIVQGTDRHPTDITVTYDGVVADRFTDIIPAAREEVRKRYDLRRPYVLYFGGFDRRKNVRGLVAAFAQSGLAQTHDLVLAGAVSAPRTALYEDFTRLPALINQHQLGEAVRRLGFVSKEEKPALLAEADVFAYPSLAEGFGLPIAEALAAGTPVVTSAIPPVQELFAEGVMMVDPGATEELAAALREAVSSPSATKIEAGRKIVQALTWRAAAEKTAAVFRHAMLG